MKENLLKNYKSPSSIFNHTQYEFFPFIVYSTHQISLYVLTYNADWLSDEAQPSAESHILGATAGRPKPDNVLDTEEHHQAYFHPKQRFVGKVAVLIDG